jgi:hypothetical protein
MGSPTSKGHILQCLLVIIATHPTFQNKTKTVFQILSRPIWTHTKNKAFRSGMTQDALCLRCEEAKTMEHLLYGCENYSAKIWNLAGWSLMLVISRHSEDYVLNIDLTPLEIVYNKPHLSILLRVKDGTTRKVLILFLQEVKWDIVFWHAQLTVHRRWEELWFKLTFFQSSNRYVARISTRPS